MTSVAASETALMTRLESFVMTSDAGFQPAWWARTGLLQTLLGQSNRATPPCYRTEILPTPDDDEVRVHFVDVADATAPVVLLLHGLEGSRESSYVTETAAQCASQGYRFCVLEFRSCGGVMNRARRSYHSGETTDTAMVATVLGQRFPNAPLFVIGFSLGANVLLKWLAESGDESFVSGAVAVSPPFDLSACSHQCDTRYGGRIARRFLSTLIPKALEKGRQHPGQYDLDAVSRCRTFRDFDDLVTAPVHGFAGADEYYRSQSSGPLVPSIRTPTMIITSVDDPLCSAGSIPYEAIEQSPFLTSQICQRGGHVAFLEGGTPWRPRRWAEAKAIEFLGQLLARPR